MSLFLVVTVALLITLLLMMVRLALGPTVFDRLQAANAIGTVAMLLLAAIGFLQGRPDFLDLALVYGLLNIVGTIAVLKFFKHGDLGESAMVAADAAGGNVAVESAAASTVTGTSVDDASHAPHPAHASRTER